MKFTLTGTGMSLAAAATLMFSACGGKSDNPDAVTLENLKAANGLTIIDQGNGTVVLSWYGSNYESKFEGYNIFGMKKTNAELGELGLEKSKPLQLLDGLGNPIEGAKNILAKFNYGTDLETPAEATTAADDEAKVSFLPIHSKAAGGEPVLPTCQPSGDTCTATTEANKKTSDVTSNGVMSYTVSGLAAGSQYCFMVFSVLDGGKQISQTSTNVECVVPKIQVTATLDPTQGTSLPYDLRAYLSACNGFTCGTLSGGTAGGAATLASEMPLYVEKYVTENLVYFVAGKNSAVQDLGEYANGFSDSELPKQAPKLTYSFDNSTNKVANGGGYSLPGESLILKAKHVYVLAVGDKDATNPTSFRYHWIYVSGATDPIKTSTFAVTMRLSVNADDR